MFADRGDLLLEAVPGLRQVAVLADPRGRQASATSSFKETVPELDASESSGAGAVNVAATPLSFFNRQRVIERTRKLCARR
jgi:hypothetical protein